MELRKAIEKQLNKVELSNRFARAVAVGNPQEYTQAEKEDQEITEDCNRLIKNSIICWNYLYLERQLEKMTDAEAKENLLHMMATHSPHGMGTYQLAGRVRFFRRKTQGLCGDSPPEISSLK